MPAASYLMFLPKLANCAALQLLAIYLYTTGEYAAFFYMLWSFFDY